MGAKDGERMGIFGAVLLFAALILVYVLIADVFTVLFRMTGLTEEKARFQVVSLLTNSGYTTRESELVASSRQRRRLARFIMIFGYAFTVTIVSSVVNIFLTMKFVDVENILVALPWPLLALLLLLLRRNTALRKKFDALIERRADRRMFRQGENHMVLLDEYGSMVIAQVHAHTLPESLRGKTVAEAGLRERSILVMLRKRGDNAADPVDGATRLIDGDSIVLFGPAQEIRELFDIEK